MTAIVGHPNAVSAEAVRRGLAFANGCLRIHYASDLKRIARTETVVLCDGWEGVVGDKGLARLEAQGCKLVKAEAQ